MAIREQVKQNYEEGLTIKQKLAKAKKIMAGILTSAGSHCVGPGVQTEVRLKKKQRLEEEAQQK